MVGYRFSFKFPFNSPTSIAANKTIVVVNFLVETGIKYRLIHESFSIEFSRKPGEKLVLIFKTQSSDKIAMRFRESFI